MFRRVGSGFNRHGRYPADWSGMCSLVDVGRGCYGDRFGVVVTVRSGSPGLLGCGIRGAVLLAAVAWLVVFTVLNQSSGDGVQQGLLDPDALPPSCILGSWSCRSPDISTVAVVCVLTTSLPTITLVRPGYCLGAGGIVLGEALLHPSGGGVRASRLRWLS